MWRGSIGTWAFNVGPHGKSPIPFPDVLEQLAELKFDGLELGGFNGYPNPQNHPNGRVQAVASDCDLNKQSTRGMPK